ncbi:UDP-glycosyltransferase 87A1-like [Humulus lupulus]|uniref:UDP-glycosyltransferase 87A1-like n=1 Tax=Humulus lupulus TaxID=3486 RepID=UPI002B403F73|nr:UDP-glycosyltransferase 87A1-like [Humulus lupulus]
MLRKRKNTIRHSSSMIGVILSEEVDIVAEIEGYFSDLFTSAGPSAEFIQEALDGIDTRFEPWENGALLRPFTESDIDPAVCDIALRLRTTLGPLISSFQSAFVPGWSIHDNVIVAFELLHSLYKKNNGRKGFMALKLDMIRGHEIVDYIPGIPTICVKDLPMILDRKVLNIAKEDTSRVSKAQFLLLTSVYKLESQVFDALKDKFPFPVYPIGPSIPNLQLQTCFDRADYFKWLDSHPQGSVLYISLGSFLSVSTPQLNEIVAGIRGSGTRYLWVARDSVSKIKDGACGDDIGVVVLWCDQLRVLCHASIGGFWTHCGWNSIFEVVFSGVPMLTCPIFWDQIPNSKQIVEDWKIGYSVIKKVGTMTIDQGLVTRDKIAELVKKLMDKESSDGKVMSKRVKKLQVVCHKAIAKGGSSNSNLDAFIKEISHGHGPK